MKPLLAVLVMVLASAADIGIGFAGTLPAGLQTDSSTIVVYPYDANRIYAVVSRTGMFTEILVPEGERIVSWFPSADEKKGWPYLVAGDRRRVMVMPMQSDSRNSAVLVTNKRSYLLVFSSVAGGVWNQRVTWQTGQMDVAEMPGNFQKGSGAIADPRVANEPEFSNMNIDYKMSGEAPFRPDLVADDGTFTWFRLPRQIQELPAIFVLNKQDKPELVNYELIGKNLVKTQRTANRWLLKLGDEEVRVSTGRDSSSGNRAGSLPDWFR